VRPFPATAVPGAAPGADEGPVRRDVVDHSLARRALLREVFGGGLFSTTCPSDVCDASVYLVRAAEELGVGTERTCPICRRALLREVSWVYGDALGAMSGTARTPRQLAALAARIPDFTVYDVEVCGDCRWNHLLRSWRPADVPGELPRRAPDEESGTARRVRSRT
jgi:hypothetical protein